MARDPVCNMDVDEMEAGRRRTEYQGKAYYFCSDHCKEEFDKNPSKYVGKEG